MDEYNRERLQAHHFAPQQCKDFYKNVDVDPKFRDCPLRTGVPMWREFETCLNRDGWTDGWNDNVKSLWSNPSEDIFTRSKHLKSSKYKFKLK